MKRVAIYCFFDEKGIVRNFVLFYLKGLKKVCDDIWVVANCDLTQDSRNKLQNLGVHVFERENQGFDVLAWKETMDLIGWENLVAYDELVICNYTCYGPIYPFEEMFSKMDDSTCDFWGAVKHPEQPTYLLPNKKGYVNEHIMTYFVVVRKKLLKSQDFKDYWDYMPPIVTKADAVGNNETVFTKHFEDLGYVSDAFVDLSNYEGRCYNSSIILANDLLIKDRCPLVKRRAFFFPEYRALLDISDTSQTIELMDFLEKETDYDTDLIWEDILQTQKISVLNNNMHLGHVLPSQAVYKNYEKKISIFIFVKEKIYVDILLEYMPEIAGIFEIKILFSEMEVGEYAATALKKYLKREDFSYVKLWGNRISQGCFSDIKAFIKNTDYVACIFNFNALNQVNQVSKEHYIRNIYDSMIKTKKYIMNIINLFESNKRLGALFPSAVDFGAYYAQNISKTKKNILINKEIYDVLDLQVPFDEKGFVNGEGVFWIRKTVVSELYNMLEMRGETLLKTNSFEFFLPMLIQNTGFYVSTVISAERAALVIDQHHYYRDAFLDRVYKFFANIGWSFSSNLANVKEKIVYRNTQIYPNREEILETHFSLRELLYLITKYPGHKLEHLKSKRKCKKHTNTKSHAIFTYLRYVTTENGRLILYFMSGKPLDKCYVQAGNKKYYSQKEVSNGRREVIEYVKEYSKAYAAFFEIPLYETKNQILKLFDEKQQQIYFKWASGISYNALELKEHGLYTRVTEEGYWIQTKDNYFKSVLKSEEYSLRDKILFVFLYYNKIHNVVIMSENLSAADNTFQLYKYCIDKKENVFYVVSESVYQSETNLKLKKRMVIQNSKKHSFLMAFSQIWISSFSLRGELFVTNGMYKDIHYSLLPASWIFIPHGMAVGDKSVAMLYKYAWDDPARTFASSKDEAEAYAEIYGFKNVTYLGSPRMDKWKNAVLNEKEIFIFFTWRLGLSKGRVLQYDSFEESDYFKTIVSIVKNVREKYPDYIIDYTFHHEVVKQGYDKIIKETLKDYDINFIYLNSIEESRKFNIHFASAKYLITDFSSVAYDFSYKDNAIAIYYLEKEFIKFHYEIEEKFYAVQLGVITKNIQELLEALSMKQPNSEMKDKREKFFYANDDKNTERVYKEIFDKQKKDATSNLVKSNSEFSKGKECKRLAVYFFYDKEGIVDDYVIFYLKKLKSVCQEICVVVNGFLTDEGRRKLQDYSDRLLVRTNKGFDSWAYKEAIESYGYEKISEKYDELILNNFTNFGPIYPFEDLFNGMDGKICDFWGITKYRAEKGQKFMELPMVDHLQSYFIVIRKNMLQSPYFRKYWRTLPCPKDYFDAVKFHELRFTQYFEQLGYISAEFIPYDAYSRKCHNTAIRMAFSQMAKYRSPLLKRKIFSIKESKYEFPLEEERTIPELVDYIRDYTDYNINLIYDNVFRTFNLEEGTPEEMREEYENKFYQLKKEATDEAGVRKAYAVKNQIYDKEELLKSFRRS